MKRLQFLRSGAKLAAGLAAAPWVARAQAPFPSRPVRIVVPYVVGGNLDVTTRLFAQHLSDELGQPFVIENRPGANGNTGTAQVLRTAPDGYTLAMVSAGTLTINPALYPTMPFDPEKDIAPISIVATGPMVLQVTNSLPVNSVPELIAYARSRPGQLNFGSGGNGTLAHLSIEMLKTRAGIDIVHVPYKGTSLATTDVMAGHLHAMFDTLSTAASLIKERKLRALAVTSARRSKAFPDLPTLQEAGVADYVAETWAGLVAPAGTPADTVSRLQSAIARIAARADVQQRLGSVGSEAVGGTPLEFARTANADRKRWSEIVRISGARAS
jgi:tripartite-type tricarboxylate transporter receptor subunit TctC